MLGIVWFLAFQGAAVALLCRRGRVGGGEEAIIPSAAVAESPAGRIKREAGDDPEGDGGWGDGDVRRRLGNVVRAAAQGAFEAGK